MVADFSPLWISLKTALLSTIVTLMLGVGISAGVLHGGKMKKWIVDTLLSLPLVLPPTVLGFFMLISFGKYSPIGALLSKIDVQIIFSWYANLLAAIVVSLPLMYQSVRAAMEKVDKEQIWAARTLGMREKEIFQKIIIPQSAPGIFSGTILSFTRALGEFGATMMIAGNIPGKTQSMSLAVYSATAGGNMEVAAFWTGVITLMSGIILAIMHRWGGRGYDGRS